MAQNGTYLCDNQGDSAAGFGLGSGDLGIPFQLPDGTWGYVFGDCFTGQEATDPYIGSPVMLYQNTFDDSGQTPITFTGSQPSPTVAQLFSYRHRADNGFGYEVSRIPNDAISLSQGSRTRLFIQYTSVAQWVAPGSADDGSLRGGVAYSDDGGAGWRDFDQHWPGSAQGSNGNPELMWSFAGVDPDGYLYIFSKAWNGSHNYAGDGGRVQLFRLRPADFFDGDFGARENWVHRGDTWQWLPAATAEPTPIFAPGNGIGEFSVKRIGETYVMSYFDTTDYSIRTRTASRPDRVWSEPKTQVVGDRGISPSRWRLPVLKNLYGGYIHPGSADPSNLTLIISAWDGTGGHRPYTATQWSGLSA
ncbi:DUF4185 domain-containing protein [Nocardia vaccinii]|uniref:DUF4185 domain-containing protein n=1 Tax=Nocardia vaccinii TaxID=1822 RepID=UPI0008348F6E|nr:DUF4185 domain-containing protein [Nocardia vaccinii]